jgi:hypothetical protein
VFPKVEQVRSGMTLGDTHLWIATPVTGVTDEELELLEEEDVLTVEVDVLLEEEDVLTVEVDVLLDEVDVLLEELTGLTLSVTNTSGVTV